MKTLTLVLANVDNALELSSAHSSEFEAMEWIYGKMLGQEFTAWPIDGDMERGSDVLFKDNIAELQLRPYPLPLNLSHLGGLGPAAVHQVWVKQEGLHGYMPWIVMTFEASTSGQDNNYALGEMRRIEGKGGMIYTHYLSPQGQRIEEHFSTERTQLRERRDVEDLKQYVQEKQQPCSSCCSAKIPGALFPVEANGLTDHAYIERCDACEIFANDETAARQLAQILDLKVGVTPQGRLYLEGISYEDAKELVGISKRAMK